jgi:hypothetical protein
MGADEVHSDARSTRHRAQEGEAVNARKFANALRLAAEALDDDDGSYVLLPRREVIRGDLPAGAGVYFLVDGDVIKVGYARSVRDRIGNHRTSNLRAWPFAVVAGDDSTEAKIHARLTAAGLRIRHEREWFHFHRQEVNKCISEHELLWTASK